MSAPTAKPLAIDRPGQAALGWLRHNLQFIVGLVVSGLAIWQLGREVDVTRVGAQLGGANWALLGLCVLSIPLTMAFKAIRWGYLFANEARPALYPRLSALYIGYLANTVLPARVGEFVRAFLIGREPGVGTPAALATIVIEKLLDLGTLFLLLLFLILANQLPPLPDQLTPSPVASGAVLVGGLLALCGLLLLRRRVVGLVAAIEARLAILRRLRVTALASSFLEALASLGRPSTLPGLVFWSAAIWAAACFTMWSGIVGVGITVSLSAVILVLVVTNIGMAAPSAPGYLGVFHYLMVKSLVPFGIFEDQAAAAAFLVHIIVFGNFIVGGLWLLRRGGYSLGGLRRASGH